MDFERDIATELKRIQRQIIPTLTKEVPPLYLPEFTTRAIPVPLAASPSDFCYFGQPWSVNVLAFYAPTVVMTTNNGTNFWTIALKDMAGTVLAQVDTSAMTAGVGARLQDLTIVQPASNSVFLVVILTATGAPGAIYVFPSVALLRTGN